MTRPKIVIEQSSRGIVGLTLARPDKGNALDAEMLAQLLTTFDRLDADPGARVLVIRGEGKHWCSGADVSGGVGDSHDVSIVDVCTRLNVLTKPTVAVVHGACIGAGLALAASCDVLLATPEAFFAIPEVRLGFPPVELMPVFVPAFGARFLRRYLLSGERFAADVALRVGFAHAVHPATAMAAAVDETADAFLRAAPGALANGKKLLRRFAAGEQAEDLHDLHARWIAGEEAREGLASFKEKRHPGWYLPTGA
ncbi:hypothetical protein DW352_09510 [Pseudolabrys taiwanensis]|uniref:Enoyl-CoA hydratase n=1 Tax=Pseudolabrys taiwanensis TaxID=331696 RepID=A0A345ZUX7_9HYPH|nr:enoyl-CoA hydratase-related protein [Pseudolabrys taiwanensis]AXK80724.1 hypothetical protein DW352_09510 [Pseudolabrys taiwanensis]